MDEGSSVTIDLGIDGLDDAVEIGRGGFGSVYRASQRNLSRTVAVKLLRDAITDERVRLRFERECWAMGTLASHPNIITVHGSGFTQRGLPYIIMEFTAKGAVADRLESSGPLPWDEVLSIGVKMAGALETAHRSGVLHRDVKPENILVSTYGEPQLADFGIARLQGSEETKTDTLTASIAHVSPDLLAGERPSALSDVYALGSTLFMLLTGSPAFIHDTDQSIVPALSRITSEPVPDLRDRGIPAPLCEVIERMMAKDTAERYATAEAAGRALQDCQRSLTRSVCPLTIVGEPLQILELDDGATSTISPAALAALPGVDSGTVQGIVADAVLASGAASGPAPESPGPSSTGPGSTGPSSTGAVGAGGPAGSTAAAPGAPRPAAAPSAPRRRLALVGGLVAVLLVAGTAGALTLLGPGGEAPAVIAVASVDRSALRDARLAPEDLDGGWVLDTDLQRQARAAVPPMLCTGVAADVEPVEAVAYRGGSPGPRVAQALRTFPEGGAAAFMERLHDEVACLEGPVGIEDLRVEELDIGDGGMLIAYTRPGSSVTLDVALIFERVGDVVSQVIHLGYPSADETLTQELMAVADRKLAGLAG